MRHKWQRGLCLYCGFHCPRCNDCKCQGKGWVKYAISTCPGFDTQAGLLRPVRVDRPR